MCNNLIYLFKLLPKTGCVEHNVRARNNIGLPWSSARTSFVHQSATERAPAIAMHSGVTSMWENNIDFLVFGTAREDGNRPRGSSSPCVCTSEFFPVFHDIHSCVILCMIHA
jgi:hypothetical protein